MLCRKSLQANLKVLLATSSPVDRPWIRLGMVVSLVVLGALSLTFGLEICFLASYILIIDTTQDIVSTPDSFHSSSTNSETSIDAGDLMREEVKVLYQAITQI